LKGVGEESKKRGRGKGEERAGVKEEVKEWG